MRSLYGKTTGKDVYESLLKELAEFSLPLEKMSGICTEGVPALVGKNTGLISLLLSSHCWDVSLVVYHCVIHQENLAEQTLKMDHVMGLVVSTANFIRSRALNHRQFKIMLEEIECEYKDLAYYCKVKWLSSTKTLQRFYSLLPEIDLFMGKKGCECDDFKDQLWTTDLVFLADITEHMPVVNLQLQGKKQEISQLWRYITAFRTQLELSEQQLREENYAYFRTLSERR
ncbi:general transcription factor II-I repeat domain-containing protein 2-like [Watersipora subatra]|uniref:general transcription factor II-I repeat domain-containing protein 2-like n=1 Tax=Watersipora subatra TaxID=2589382 RepID=UPI00355B7C9D